MPVIMPLEVYEALEKTLGYEDAKDLVKSIETAISDVTEYKWRISKEELLSEIRKEFDKMDAKFERKFSEIRKEFENMDSKFERKLSELDAKFERRFSELDKKFATKADLALMESKMMGEFKRIDGEFKRIDGEFKALRLEMKLLFLIIIFIMLITNPRALDMIAKVLGLAR
ncbi:MAG: hypothetical protein HQL03_12930 [Nitrospirae bacterium]|nr:hypothetical protein [Nitrospirota bacterium]